MSTQQTIELARQANSIETRFTSTAPMEVLAAIARVDRALDYSSARHIFYCICMGLSYKAGQPGPGAYDFAGVFGDGNNGCYEWFIFESGKLEYSNKGYGDTTVALLEVLTLLRQRGQL